jgi:hypothetical protein
MKKSSNYMDIDTDTGSSSDDMDIDRPRMHLHYRKKSRSPRKTVKPKELKKAMPRTRRIDNNTRMLYKGTDNNMHDYKIVKNKIIPDFMNIDIKHDSKLYDKILYKTKIQYNLTIPILDKYKIKYETWNNPDNTSGTCFWHATSKALSIPMDELTKQIEVLKTHLPPVMQKMYKTRYLIADRLSQYKTKSFGVDHRDFCMVPKLAPDTALVVFFIYEVKPKQFAAMQPAVKCYAPKHGIKPTKVVFMCYMMFINSDKKTNKKEPYSGHIEIMTLAAQKLQHGWTQDLKSVAPELKKILTHGSCQFIERF